MQCVVLKPFKANGEELIARQLVDASDFRNREKLILSRYIRVATTAEIDAAFEVPVKQAMRLRRKRTAAVN